MTTAAELDALIEELTVDAYNDEEQLSGFLVGAEEALGARHEVALADLTLAPRSELGAVVAAYRRWQGR